MQQIVLSEYESVEVSMSTTTARSLMEIPGKPLEISPGFERGTWRLTASATVGTAAAGDVQVLIRAKVSMANLMSLMDVEIPSETLSDDLFDYEHEPDLLRVLVRIFVHGLNRALGQGLRHDYEHRQERLVTFRGRLDVAATVRRPGPVLPIACRFDEYTSDIPLNRLLVAAIEIALRVPSIPTNDRNALKRQLTHFEDVGLDPGPYDWVERWQPSRLDRHYVGAVRPAVMLLRHLTLNDRSGSQSAPSFLIDMNKLFEHFVTRRLRELLAGALTVEGQHLAHLGEGGQVDIYPDIVVHGERGPVFVADTKYKLMANRGMAATDDLYQLFAYSTVLGLSEGALIACRRRGEAPAGPLVVERSGVTLNVWALDLSANRAAVDEQLQTMAGSIGGTT